MRLPALEVVGGCGVNCRLNNFAHCCASQTGSLLKMSDVCGCPQNPLTVLHSKEAPFPRLMPSGVLSISPTCKS